MALDITPVTNHRTREKGIIVYPVYSRRSAGLSVGINLFPDRKNCQFDCPYCEVFPFSGNAEFSLTQMEEDLKSAISSAHDQNIQVKDICFSGNGEPTVSPAFCDALKLAEKIRVIAAPFAKLVVITNGAGLLQERIFAYLKEAAANPALDIWLKFDAGTPQWYQKINKSALSHDMLSQKIKDFAFCAPVTIQTMLCAVEGNAPPDEEAQAYDAFLLALAENGNLRKVQLYGKARAAPQDPLASQLPQEYLEKRKKSLCGTFAKKGIITPIEVYI
ncbi:MAG: hypothetical protein FWC01_07350 [Treponema sp.]|nr:hypothetical protein [Treponema sp.]MCL2237665.1 hypothetical protein [Treponema sp.]